MNKDLWEIVALLCTCLTPLREANSALTISREDLLELRAQLRTHLEQLRTLITAQHSERDAYLVLFPLTAHCDEIVKNRILETQDLEWPPLQQELYQVIDAGDLFYELLDNILTKPETLPVVYEVYYFCLNDGFRGRYSGHPDRLEVWLEKLRNHIVLQPITITVTAPEPHNKWANFRRLKRLYYGGCGLLLLLLYFLLTFLASTWDPSA